MFDALARFSPPRHDADASSRLGRPPRLGVVPDLSSLGGAAPREMLQKAWELLGSVAGPSASYAERRDTLEEVVRLVKEAAAWVTFRQLEGTYGDALKAVAADIEWLRDIAAAEKDPYPTNPPSLENWGPRVERTLSRLLAASASFSAGPKFQYISLLPGVAAFPSKNVNPGGSGGAFPPKDLELGTGGKSGNGGGGATTEPIIGGEGKAGTGAEGDKKKDRIPPDASGQCPPGYYLEVNQAGQGECVLKEKPSGSGGDKEGASGGAAGVVKCALCDATEATQGYATGAAALVGGLIGGLGATFLSKPGNYGVLVASVLGGALVVGGTTRIIIGRRVEACKADCGGSSKEADA